MRPSLDPRGILLAHTLPALLLFYLLGQLFGYIRPALDAEALQLWRTYAVWLGIGTLSATVYATWCIVNKRPIHFIYGLLVFASYVPLLWWSMDQASALFPSDVPFWMVPDETRLYAIRILSVSLLHALIVLVGASLPSGEKGKPVRDLLIAVAIPLLSYLFVQVVHPFDHGIDFEKHTWIVVMVVLVVAFLFLVFRGLFALIRRRASSGGWAFAVRILTALVLPLLGLALHNGHLGREGMGVFGDLSHWSFYVIAILNGLVVIWEPSHDPRTRLFQFLFRSAGFSYVLYFFVLFLPFLPLSIVAIIGFGLGFLLLSPVLLFLVQGMQLWNDIRFLRVHFSTPLLIAGMIGALSVLPTIITGVFLYQRSTLHHALDGVYHPAPDDDLTRIDAAALGRVLTHVAANKQRRGWALEHTPFLTPWYNKVVLDDLTLSDEKLDHLQRIFIGKAPQDHFQARDLRPQRTSEVTLDSVSTRATFDGEQQVWRTWVDLCMTNHNGWQAEFSTVFKLPRGAYISDEYLMIDDERVHGILAERKAATWIYQQIRDFRRDPSLTTYAGPDAISLKVFPLEGGETRYAGFEVLHKEPLPLALDTFHVVLGDASSPVPPEAIMTSDGFMVYMPVAAKQRSPLVERGVQVHVLVDGSETAAQDRTAVMDRIERCMSQQGIRAEAITLHIADIRSRSFVWGDEAMNAYTQHEAMGGFFSDRPIREVLTKACMAPANEQPLIVIAPAHTDNTTDVGVLMDGLDELATCHAGRPNFLLLEADGSLSERRYDQPLDVLSTDVAIERTQLAYAWPNADDPRAYFATDSLPGTALLTLPDNTNEAPLRTRNWSDALSLDHRWRALALRPEQGTAGWLAVVRGSFQAQVLSPFTAWICLESDLQRNALMKKQEETLSANAALDAGEEELVRMTEPGILWFLLPLLWLWYRSRKPQ